MLPDTGERYLTTPLFDGIPEDMDEEEIGALALDARLPAGLTRMTRRRESQP